jgi:hypothetical protein
LVKRIIKLDLNKVPEISPTDDPIIIQIIHREGYDLTKAGVLKQSTKEIDPSTTLRFDRLGKENAKEEGI